MNWVQIGCDRKFLEALGQLSERSAMPIEFALSVKRIRDAELWRRAHAIKRPGDTDVKAIILRIKPIVDSDVLGKVADMLPPDC